MRDRVTDGQTATAGPGRPPAARIDPATSMGTVRLTVSDLSRSRDYYERAVGLTATELDDGSVGLGIPGAARPLVELRGDPAAPRRNRRATGLFHLAVLLPSRADLALALVRLADAQAPLDGASDHLVSEALYLSDPDGNGIEIYRDRPREEWPRANGTIAMDTLPLDLENVIGELADPEVRQAAVPTGTRIGHVHLQVSDLGQAESFYSGVLGFDVTVRGYPGALFVSAGGYHHHLGLNTWRSAGAGPPAPGSIGLRSFEIVLPDDRELSRVLDRVGKAGIAAEHDGDGSLIRDPSGNHVLLRAA